MPCLLGVSRHVWYHRSACGKGDRLGPLRPNNASRLLDYTLSNAEYDRPLGRKGSLPGSGSHHGSGWPAWFSV